jgi:hypothetical protein
MFAQSLKVGQEKSCTAACVSSSPNYNQTKKNMVKERFMADFLFAKSKDPCLTPAQGRNLPQPVLDFFGES